MMMMKHYYHFYLMMSSSILGFLDGVSAEAPLSVSKKVVFGGSPLVKFVKLLVQMYSCVLPFPLSLFLF